MRHAALHGSIPGVVTAAVVVGGIVVSSGAMWQASSAAFTADTTNGTNTWNAGSVTLTDDDSGAAMFTATNLKPGSTGEKCITLTYNGSSAAAVKLYGTAVTGSLGAYIDLVVEQGDGGSFGSCTGFGTATSVYTGTLTNFGSTRTGFANGAGTFAPTAAGQSKTYRFAYTINAAAPDAAQGTSASATFTWEAR